jgi:hypothetical protein
VEGDLVFAGEPGPTAAASRGGPEGDTGMEDTVDFDVPASHRVKVRGRNCEVFSGFESKFDRQRGFCFRWDARLHGNG